MLKRTCFAATLIGLLTTLPTQAQEYYSNNKTASGRFTSVSFGDANHIIGPAQDDDADAAVDELSDAETLAELREQIKLMSLRLRELEEDVAKKVKVAQKQAPQVKASSAKGNLDTDARLKQLEKGFQAQSKSIDKIDRTIPGLVHSAHGNPKISLFGRIHLDYWAFPDTDEGTEILEGEDPLDRVEFRRLRLGVKGDLNDNIFYVFEGEFAGGATTGYRDAFIGFRDLPALNTVIIGNHKRPYGLDHLNDSNFNVFTERALIIEAFNEESRRLGISSNGVSDDLGWNWRYGVWNQELTQDTFGWQGDHYQSEIAGRIARTAWYDESSGGRGYWHWGVAGSWGSVDGGSANNQAQYRTRPEALTNSRFLDTGQIAGAEENSLIALETVFNAGAFQLTAEFQQVFVNRDNAVGQNVGFGGGYVQAAYFLTGEHTPWNRRTGTVGRVKPFENFFTVTDVDGNRGTGLGAWQVAARYSYADLQDEDIIGGKGESLTLGLNWWWNPHARLQLNYIVGETERQPIAEGDYQILGLRWQVDY